MISVVSTFCTAVVSFPLFDTICKTVLVDHFGVQMVFAALVMIRAEILWFFSHVGVTVGKTKGARVMPIEMVIIYFPTSALCSFYVEA